MGSCKQILLLYIIMIYRKLTYCFLNEGTLKLMKFHQAIDNRSPFEFLLPSHMARNIDPNRTCHRGIKIVSHGNRYT